MAIEQLRRGRLERLAALVDAGLNLDAGGTLLPFGLLHYVIAGQRRGGLPGVEARAAVATLLELGCNPTGCGAAAGLPLYLAAQLKQWPIFDQLLEAGADPNVLPPQARASLAAVVMRADDPMPLLASLGRQGADFNAGASAGVLTGPEAALGRGHVAALRFMLEHGADASTCNALGESLAHLAIADARALATLADCGANFDRPDPSGFTPLMMTCRASVPIESMQVLIAAGADVNARTHHGESALHVNAWGLGDVARARLLIAAGVDLDARDHRGSTAAMVAATAQRAELFDTLAQAGAEIRDVVDPVCALAHIQRLIGTSAERGMLEAGRRFAAFAVSRINLRAADEALRARFVRIFAEAGMQAELAHIVQQGCPV